MKIWKSLLVLLLISLGSWGAFEVYQRFILSRSILSLELISSDAIFIFETRQADQTWQELQKQDVWTALSRFPTFQSLSKQMASLDSLAGESGFVTKTLRNKHVTVSYHAVGADQFNLLFTINFGSSSPQELLEQFTTKLPRSTRIQRRKYSDQDILDIVDTKNRVQWSITTLNNVLLFSSSSYVIEEAIRFYLSDTPNRISDKLGEDLNSEKGLGRLILSSKGIAKLLGGLSANKSASSYLHLQSTDYLLALDLAFEENELVFKGPIRGLEEIDFLPSIQSQLGDFENWIPNGVQSIAQVNLKDIYESQKLTDAGFVAISTVSGEIQSRLIDRGFFDYLSGQQYFLEMEALEPTQKNLALFVKMQQAQQAWEVVKDYRDSTEFFPVEEYRGNEIVFFPEQNLPAHLFKGKYAGFEQTYLTRVGDILVMSNSAGGMKRLLDDYFEGNTWGKGEQGGSGQVLSPASGYSKTYLLPKIWDSWIQTAKPSWSTYIQKYEAEFQAFPSVSLRVNQSSKGPEATLSLRYTTQAGAGTGEKKSFELASGKQVSFEAPLIFGPKSIKNFNDGTEDLVVQDQNHVLYVINSAGEQAYSQALSGPVLSDVFQLDYFKNGKLQLMLATAEKIYAIDRLGEPLPGFPKALAGEKILQLNVLDYDQTRDYRYFVATESGNLWLFDKSGKELEGWNPLPLGEKTLGTPFHARVVGKGDFMVVLGISGKLNLFNRRGEHQPGSPLQLPQGIASPLTFVRGSSPKLRTLTETGEILEVSFAGMLLGKTQLEKTNRDDRFRNIPDQAGNSSLLLTEQFNKLQLVDPQGKTVLILPIPGKQAWVGYFDFGSDRKIVTITDLQQGLGYLYDQTGTLLISSPLQSQGEIQISHQPDLGQYLIRTRIGNSLLEYLIPD